MWFYIHWIESFLQLLNLQPRVTEKIRQSVERFIVNYLYFELETSRYLIVIAKMLPLSKAPINLVLSHLKKNHSLVIIQLCISAILNLVFSATLNFCWHQERDRLSAGCSMVAFAGIVIVPTTWDWSAGAAKMFLEPTTLLDFYSVWSGWKGSKQSRAWLWG